MLDLRDDPLAAGLSQYSGGQQLGGRRDQLASGSLFARGAANNGLRFVPAQQQAAPAPVRRRSRIWDLNASFHCSIVGTCLTNAELRQVLGKYDLGNVQALSDHELHKNGVTLAGQGDGSAKLLQKALDRRHERVIHQFDKAKSEADVARLWDESVQRGEIPGAYWAVLTHPSTGDALMKRAFGEVHMLSHLVGAANRADIRRLRELEDENAALREKVERQQMQIRDIAVARDAKIRDLDTLLMQASAATAAPRAEATAATAALIESLERRLASEAGHRDRIEARLRQAEERLKTERAARMDAEALAGTLRREMDIVEAALVAQDTAPELAGMLDGKTALYVGGQTGLAAGLREIAQRFDARLLHHDGGVEDSGAQLAGLISQSDIVFFPVDCVSHSAMHAVKRFCRQTGKAYVPLRSAGLTSFLAALRVAANNSPRSADPGF